MAASDNEIVKKPWIATTIGENCFLIKGLFDSNPKRYDIAIYDCDSIWYESAHGNELERRFTKFNPNIEATLEYFISQLEKRFLRNNLENTTVSKSHDTLTVEMKWKIAEGVPFYWKFTLQKDNTQQSQQLVIPLFMIVNELLRRQSELHKILLRKDKEIQDYKDQGVTVSKRQLATTKFSLRDFKDQCNTSNALLTQNKTDALRVFQDKEFQDLYENIVDRKNSVTDVVAASTQQLFETQIITTHDEDTQRIVNSPGNDSSCSSSPIKNVQDSPAKDMELIRRDAIRKRLAEEEEKKKKGKKKKLNL